MRIYCFGNFYLSSIQQGIQALHVLGEMVAKYGIKRVAQDAGYNESVFSGSTPQSTMLATFLAEHKTAILLNGGAQKELMVFFHSLKKVRMTEKTNFHTLSLGKRKLLSTTLSLVLVSSFLSKFMNWQTGSRKILTNSFNFELKSNLIERGLHTMTMKIRNA